MSGRQLWNKQCTHEDPHRRYRCHSRHHLWILSRSATCTGACQTYFPQSQTRCVDPGSILSDQSRRPDKATRVGMYNTDACICAPSHLVYKLVYISNQHWEITPSLEIN